MRVKDIEFGQYYYYQPSNALKPDIIRVEGVAEREYKGERTKFRATRFLLAGPRRLRIPADIILSKVEPNERHMRIIRMIEEGEDHAA